MKSPVGGNKSKPAGQVLEAKSKKSQCALNRPWTQHTSYPTVFLSNDLAKHPSTNPPTDPTTDPTADPTPIRPIEDPMPDDTTTEAKLEYNIKSLLCDAAVQAAVRRTLRPTRTSPPSSTLDSLTRTPTPVTQCGVRTM